jgi:hypothetical protein
MSKSNTHENDYLKLVLWGTAISNIADNAATSPLTQVFLGLHTGDPGEGGNQQTSECAYAPYARVGVSRSSSGWDIANNVANLHAVQSFPTCTSGTETATHFSVGTAETGTGKIIWSGAISPNISISVGITPQLGVGTSITED